MGEAKASGNLGNTLKVLGRFDEAIVCCQRHLDIAQEQGDKVSGQTRGSSALPVPAGALTLKHQAKQWAQPPLPPNSQRMEGVEGRTGFLLWDSAGQGTRTQSTLG